MSREVRRVPASWEHPKKETGHYIPLNEHFPYSQEEIEGELRAGHLKNDPPNYGCKVMPQWSDAERTHYQMYESVTEGTPISPVMETQEALACWLVDNKVSAGPYATATYDQWLAMIKVGSSDGSFELNIATGEIMSGVEVASHFK